MPPSARIGIGWTIVLCLACVTRPNEALVKSTSRIEIGSMAESRLRDTLEGLEISAILRQREAWARVESSEHRALTLRTAKSALENRRLAMLHCHVGTPFRQYDLEGAYEPSGRIATLAPGQLAELNTAVRRDGLNAWICPNWIPEIPWDMRARAHVYDKRLAEPARMVRFPDALIDVFELASRTYPQDAWFFHQALRMRLDNGDYTHAESLVAKCTLAESACGLLRGLVSYRAGAPDSAAQYFKRSLAVGDNALRCRVSNASALLSPSDADRYRGMTCVSRSAIDESLWWLATPFFVEGYNARFAEHVARRLSSDLELEVAANAFYSLRSSADQSAVSEIKLRYGPAPHMLGVTDAWNQTERAFMGALARAPFSAPEFDPLSASTVPPLSVALVPYAVANGDFLLSGPASPSATVWWPREFYRHSAGAILALSNVQYTLLRRENSALLILASSNDSTLAVLPREARLSYALVLSSGPMRTQTVARASVGAHEVVRMSAAIADPSVVGLEFLYGRGGIAGARARFGIATVPTLNDMRQGGCGLSAPMLAEPPTSVIDTAPNGFDKAFGTTNLRAIKKIRVIWESYGFGAQDTTQYTVSVSSLTTQMAADATASIDESALVAMRWAHGSPAHQVSAPVRGSRAVLHHELVLDIHTLRKGGYLLRVQLAGKGCPTVTAAREFSVL